MGLARWKDKRRERQRLTSLWMYLFLLSSFLCGAVVGFLKQDLLHLPVLQVVQLSHSVFGARDQIHHYRMGALST